MNSLPSLSPGNRVRLHAVLQRLHSDFHLAVPHGHRESPRSQVPTQIGFDAVSVCSLQVGVQFLSLGRRNFRSPI